MRMLTHVYENQSCQEAVAKKTQDLGRERGDIVQDAGELGSFAACFGYHVKNFSPRLVWKDPRKGMSTTWRQKSESQKGEGQTGRHSTNALSEIKPNNNLGEILR